MSDFSKSTFLKKSKEVKRGQIFLMPRKRILTEQEIADKAQRLIYLINFSRMSRADICEGTDIKPDTLYRWMTGKLQGIGRSGAASLLSRLRKLGIICTEDWLLFGEGSLPYRSLSVDGERDFEADLVSIKQENDPCSEEKEKQKLKVDEGLKREILFFQENNLNAIGIFLRDNSMEPVFKAGDYLAGTRTQNFEEILGEFCVVQLENSGELEVCRLERGSESSLFTLLFLNPNESRPIVLLNQRIITAARIIWRRRPSLI
jgi:hypothetical protein